MPIFQDEQFYDPQFLRMEYGLIGQTRHGAVVEDDMVTRVKTVTGKEKVRLEPFRRNERAVCEVTMRYRLKMPDQYRDITSFAGATTGVELRVEDVPDGFDFVSVGETTSTTHLNGDKVWHFDRPFVTNQHIRVWWFKKKRASA